MKPNVRLYQTHFLHAHANLAMALFEHHKPTTLQSLYDLTRSALRLM